MNIRESLIGQIIPCAICKKESQVEDFDSITVPLADRDLLDKNHSTTIAPMPVDESEPSRTSIGYLAKWTILMIAVVCVLFGIFNKGPLQPLCFSLAVSNIVTLVILWPFYTMANDTRINRRLLEQLVEQGRK